MTITYLPDRNCALCGKRFHPKAAPQRFCDIVCARSSKVTRDAPPIPDTGEEDAAIRDASWRFAEAGLRLEGEELPVRFVGRRRWVGV